MTFDSKALVRAGFLFQAFGYLILSFLEFLKGFSDFSKCFVLSNQTCHFSFICYLSQGLAYLIQFGSSSCPNLQLQLVHLSQLYLAYPYLWQLIFLICFSLDFDTYH
jgi:hypothetical protein